MSNTTPNAWRCKHCNERVDPTMAMCWSCGRDRNGESQEDLSLLIDEELMVKPEQVSLANPMGHRRVLIRLFFLSWCVTGLFAMIAGPTTRHMGYGYASTPAQHIVSMCFVISLILTAAVISDRLVLQRNATTQGVAALSDTLHRPWVRRWMLRGWGCVLFWFAWLWLLLNYI